MATLTDVEFSMSVSQTFKIKCAQNKMWVCPALKNLAEKETYTLEIWSVPTMTERSVTIYPTAYSDRMNPADSVKVMQEIKDICRHCKHNKTKSRIR